MRNLRITPEWAYLRRREFVAGGTLSLLGMALSRLAWADAGLAFLKPPQFAQVPSGRQLTTEKYATGYNNFYEFSLDKKEVASKVQDWNINSWSIEVGGLVKKPRRWSLDEVLKKFPLEERIYRFRCVEAWSMVLPWMGFSLAKWLKEMEPDSSARYVKFTSFADAKVMPNINALPDYPWPYTEGLTMAEAMHPLTMIAVGLYGKKLPRQNGAPIRLVVPWKYGFKSIKSIVKIELVKDRPQTLWSSLAPKEYGFYANVNPEVSHPRWTQESERVVDGSFFPKRVKTLKFNGYEKEVASLYAGLDLHKEI